jgi:plasmid stability protein
VLDRLADTDHDALADRLVWVLTRADTPAGRAEITRRMLQDDLPRAASIHAAGRLGLVQVADRVRKVLTEATRPGSGVTEPQLLAALIAAGRLGLDARAETRKILDTLWAPKLNWAMFLAVEHLGRQVRLHPESPGSEACIETLQTAARYESAAAPGATAVPSAAAAAELWLLAPQPSWYRLETPPAQTDPPQIEAYAFDNDGPAWWVQHLAGADNSLAGDVLAWKLGRSARPEARQLAERILDGPIPVHNNNRLGAAAMMLALSARAEGLGAEQAGRILRSRLYTRFGMVEDYHLRSSYQAALAVLGDHQAAENVRRLFELGVGPTRRVFTSLLLAGDKTAVDWVLLSGILGPKDLVDFFLNRAAGRVMHAIAGDVPLPQLPADPAQRAWQVRMLRQFWLQHRHSVELQWPR